jgi:tRNA (guanine-N7-)-methyltransferase
MPESRLRPEYVSVLDGRRAELRERINAILPSSSGGRFLWEVGCGHGHFLTAYAAAHPEKCCIGVDLVSERIERADRKRERAQVPNLHFIRAEARLFLECLPSHSRITEVFILFPDPWPKSRHHKHRVLQAEFLSSLAARCEPGARLYFRTDYRPYFEDAAATLRESHAWELVEQPWPFEFETVFQSRAEQHHSLIAQARNPVIS